METRKIEREKLGFREIFTVLIMILMISYRDKFLGLSDGNLLPNFDHHLVFL